MKIIDIDGTAYERGLSQGEQLRDDYRGLMESFFTSNLWKTNRPGPVPDIIVKGALAAAGPILTRPSVKRLMPAQVDRVRGIAKGLGEGVGLVWGIQFLEVMFCEAGKSLMAPKGVTGGCTQIHATGAATACGTPLTGRNYDFPNLLEKFQVVRREIPSEPGRLAYTAVSQSALAGVHMGINEAGLLVSANNARLWEGDDLKKKGVPYEMILLEILETCKNTAEAVEYAMRFPARSNAGFFGFSDEGGDCRVLEFTASRHMARRPDENGIIAQTNHYIAMTDANLPDGTFWTVKGMEGLEYARSTRERYRAADALLKRDAGRITVESLMSILRDHDGLETGNDCTVCSHGDSGSTLASMVVDIKERTMHVAQGRPCESEYMRVDFRGRAKTAAEKPLAAAGKISQ